MLPTITTLAPAWSAAQAAADLLGSSTVSAEECAARLHPCGWSGQRDAIDAAFGVETLERAFDQAARASEALATQIAALRPNDTAEAAVKFAALLKLYGDGQGGIDQPAPIFAFLEDLQRLAGPPAG